MVDPRVSKCALCSAPFVPAPTGRPKRYCSHACRQGALRRRQGSKPRARLTAPVEIKSAEPRPATPRTVVPAPSPDVRRQVFAEELRASLGTESEDAGVAQTILDTKALAYRFDRLGVESRPEWAWRCASLADAIRQALRQNFGDL